MPFTLTVLVVAVGLGAARGGRLRRIADAPLEATGLLFAGVVLQAAVGSVGPWPGLVAGGAATLLLLASQALVLAWVWRNRLWRGTGLVAAGLLLNTAVIAANGAMPVDPQALTRIGAVGVGIDSGKHVLLSDATRLGMLADRWPLPPLRTVISLGDAVLAAGLVPLVHALMTYRPRAARRGGHRARRRGRRRGRLTAHPARTADRPPDADG